LHHPSKDRLWIDSTDSGIDAIAPAPNGWRRYRRLSDQSIKSVLDAESGERLSVVDWESPFLDGEAVRRPKQ